jgi:glucarate dehydratase
MGRKLGVPVCDLLGGRVRDAVSFASYLFFRYSDPKRGQGEVRTPDQVVAHARALKAKHGFTAHKLKGGVFPPAHELECFRALAAAFPGERVRYDPNSALSLHDAIQFGKAILDLNNDYFEDPVWGLPQLARLKELVPIPIATNTVVVNFEQLAANVLQRAVDVILLDTTFWGGIRPCIKAAGVCETFGLGVAVHSSGELGIQLATMLHLGAVLPNLAYAADAHYHHLVDDVIVGGKLPYRNGAIRVPEGPGLGVELDREKLEQYHILFKELGGYLYDRDPGRPDWFPLVPNDQWADPRRSQSLRLG